MRKLVIYIILAVISVFLVSSGMIPMNNYTVSTSIILAGVLGALIGMTLGQLSQ